MMDIIVWLPNGFKPGDPTNIDHFSETALNLALDLCQKLWNEGQQVYLYFPRSKVISKAPSGCQKILWQTMKAKAEEAIRYRNQASLCGFNVNCTRMTTMETVGGPTDAGALCNDITAIPNLGETTLVAVSKSTAKYFRSLYAGVAEHIVRRSWEFDIVYPSDGPKESLRTFCLYRSLAAVSEFCRKNSRSLFILFCKALTWVQAFTRLRFGFTVTVR